MSIRRHLLAHAATATLTTMLALPASAVLTNVTVTGGGPAVDSVTIVIRDAQTDEVVAQVETDRDGYAHVDLAAGGQYVAEANGIRSAPFNAGDSVSVPLSTAGGGQGILVSVELGGGYLGSDSGVNVGGNVQSRRVEEQRLGPFFDSPVFRQEFVTNDPIDFNSDTGPSDGIGWFAARVDTPAPDFLPFGAHPFVSVGSAGLFNDPSDSDNAVVEGQGIDFEVTIEDDITVAAGVSIPIFGDDGRVLFDLGAAFAWQDVSLDGRVGNATASSSADFFFLGPQIGASIIIFETDQVQVSGFANGQWLFPVGSGSETLQVGSGSNGAAFEYSPDSQGRIIFGVRAAVNVLGGN